MNAFLKHRVRVGGTALAAAFAAFLVASLAVGPAQAAPLPAGTTITGTLSTDLNTKDVNVGDGFSVAITPPYPNDDNSYAGAYVKGHVATVQRAGQGTKPQLQLAFDTIVFPNGLVAPVSGHVTKIDEKKGSAVAQQAAGAGVGMVLGNYLGKHLGTNLGGLFGAAGGFLYGNNLKTNFTVPKGSTVSLQTDSLVPRPQARH